MARASQRNEAEARDHARRMRWFREARFGMFIHWGIYATAGGRWNGRTLPGVGEWLLNNGRIPIEEYIPLKDRFTAAKFDADQWASIAQDAGMRYLVLTSKHHDGFCLWKSETTDWGVQSTPFGRDIIAELSAACRRRGIRFCLYHSIMDWHHPDYLPRRPWDKRSTAGADFNRYVTYMKSQLRELVTKYGPLGVLWFDGEWEPTWTHAQGKDLYNYVRSLQRDILINNRVDKGRNGMQGLTIGDDFAGDFGTPEQEIPPTGLPGVDWESCMTMNDTWGYKIGDENWKSSETLLRNLIDIASKGGNYLLNVGPDGDGVIPAPSVERLRDIGKWMRRNGASIYGTQASPFPKPLPWGRVTRKETGGKHLLYLHCFENNRSVLDLPGLRTPILGAKQLESRERITVAEAASGPTIAIGNSASTGIRTFEVRLAGPPVVSA